MEEAEISIEIDREIQELQREFLEPGEEPGPIEESAETDGSEDDELDPDTLEPAAEIELGTGCASADQEVSKYLERGCGCSKYMNGPFSSSPSSEEVTSYRLFISEIDRAELDLILLARLNAGMNAGDLLTNTRGTVRPAVRQRVTFSFVFRGKSICREMFIFLHRISRTRLYNLTQHLCENGMVVRYHGNKGKKPKHACAFTDITRVVHFIKAYADAHAMPLPGCLPKHNDYRVMKLPSDVSKATVHREYVKASQELQYTDEQIRIVSYREFCRLWQELVPEIRVFCEPEYADITCPQPNSVTNTSTENYLAPSQPKRARLCSHCKHPGHTKTVRGKVTCPQLLK